METSKPQRRSIRLKGYDYTQPGAYFVTFCTHNRMPILWEDHAESKTLSKFGRIAEHAWLELPDQFSNLRLDKFCIMPNHIHGIIQLLDTDTRSHGLAEIVRWYKSISGRRINSARQATGLPVWQRNYYEHIIRNEKEWSQIRAYISMNAENWKNDRNFLSISGECNNEPDD